jgi:hypothetical protein
MTCKCDLRGANMWLGCTCEHLNFQKSLDSCRDPQTEFNVIMKKITEQKFFSVAPADYIPVPVNNMIQTIHSEDIADIVSFITDTYNSLFAIEPTSYIPKTYSETLPCLECHMNAVCSSDCTTKKFPNTSTTEMIPFTPGQVFNIPYRCGYCGGAKNDHYPDCLLITGP